MICNRTAIEETAIETIGIPGKFCMKMFTHGKNKFHSTNRKKCMVQIFETKDGGLKAKFLEDYGMYRYWFWIKEL